MGQAALVGFQLSPLQKALWPIQAATPANLFCRVSVTGELDAEKLRVCFERVVQRHEALRTTFRQHAGLTVPFQVIRETREFSWEYFDEAAPGGFKEAGLSDGPALAVRVLRTGASEHLLSIRVFALCADAASLRNLIDEVARAYADFAQWQTELVSGAETEESREAKQFWSAPPAILRLPFERRIPDACAAGHATYPFRMEIGTAGGSAKIERLLFACWQALLWRLTNQASITVSRICEGRGSEELRSSIGLFAQPLPITCNFDEGLTFREWLTRSEQSVAAAEQWQYYCPPEAGGTPREGIGFEFQQIELAQQAEPQTSGGVRFSIERISPHAWPFKVSLLCRESGNSVDAELLYDDRFLPAADIARIAKYLERTVRAALGDPDESVLSFDLLNDAERETILIQGQAERVASTDTRCLHELFESQAARTPNRAAVVVENIELTYSELNASANRLAHLLRTYGVGPNVKVGLCLERSAEMISAVLGILKAGGAYVPLLPEMPAARLAHQLQETAAPVIVTVEGLLDRLPDYTGRVVCLDRDRKELEKQPAENPVHQVTAPDLIYVLYTSGSTGVPKGVAVRHGNVTNYTHSICHLLGLDDPDSASRISPPLTFATVSTLGADLGNTAIFPSLVTGGCLCVIGSEASTDARLFAQRMREHPIDVLKITPSNMNALMLSGNAAEVLPQRHLIVGGEACSWDLAHRVFEAGQCAMTNHYGPTEATIGCLTYAIRKHDDPAEPYAATVPLGRPISNTQVYVLDTHRRPVPAGVAGEIYVSGEGVSEGYIGRPQETAQRFLEHPFIAGGGLLYRTGDRGRFLPDGSIEFLGRVDDQVKIRGHRVELAEIESVLATHPAVQQAVVLLERNDTGEYLTACAIADPALAAADLESYLRQRLPVYMIPNRFVIVDQFPLNTNGKVDRPRLAEKMGAAKTPSGTVAPRNPIEERLVEIWKEVLAIAQVGITDNFFDLGGHSLLAMVMVSRIRAAFEVQVTIRTLFEAPTIEALAVAVGAAEALGAEDAEMSDLLEELEGLSDQETTQLLGQDTVHRLNSTSAGRE